MRTAIALMCILGSNAVVAEDVFRIDPAHSRIEFKVHQYLGTVTGRFTQFSGTIKLDREHPEKSSVATAIEVKSIDTGIKKRDQHLCSSEFFNVAQFPEITFKSQSVKQTGPDSASILGDFTMHGVTRPVTLQVKSLAPIGGNDPVTRWQITTKPLDRGEFNLRFSKASEAMSGIADEVSIDLAIEATRSR